MFIGNEIPIFAVYELYSDVHVVISNTFLCCNDVITMRKYEDQSLDV